MAASKAPKNDFAPAWLKIPTADSKGQKGYENDRPGRSSGNKRGDFYPQGPDYGYHPLTKQRSLDQYHEGHRYGTQKHRHHSADEDFFGPPYPGLPYYNGYNYDKYSSQYRSQPALFRPQARDKYPPPPPSRFGQMNGMYPAYPYDPYTFDLLPGDPYHNNFNWPYTGGGKRNHYDREKNSSKQEKSDRSKKDKDIDEDFPSLKGEGDMTEAKSGKPASGVWDKPLKVNTSQAMNDSPQQSPGDTSSKENKNQGNGNANMYKAFVPNKGLLSRKPAKEVLKLNGRDKPPTPTGLHGPVFKGRENSSKSSGPVVLTKEGTRQSPTPPIDILNSQLVTQPKTLGDKKSNFLRQLKKERNTGKGDEKDKIGMDDAQTNGELDHSNHSGLVNGLEGMSVSPPDDQPLSSSLEAEHRLLREMGWREDDYEECEITEDERKEVERLSNQMKQQKNGFKRTLPKTWSPQHIPVFHVPPEDLQESLSTDSESDLD